jgi:hypothetical protein
MSVSFSNRVTIIPDSLKESEEEPALVSLHVNGCLFSLATADASPITMDEDE